MAVTLSGISTLINDVHSENAELPMVVTPLGISMLVNDQHPANAA